MIKKIWDIFTDKLGSTIIHPQYIMKGLNTQSVEETKKYSNKGRLVDIGCGRMPYKKKLAKYVSEYIGVDHPEFYKKNKYSNKPDVLADATNLPFPNSSFDIALMLQVLEYIKNPQKAVEEVSRILKKNGILILSSPFLYPIHDYPYDRYRFTDSQLKEFLEIAKLKPIKISPQGGFWDFYLQALLVFLFKRTQQMISKGNIHLLMAIPLLIISSLLVLPINLISIFINLVSRIFPKFENDFPLNFLVVAKKV